MVPHVENGLCTCGKIVAMELPDQRDEIIDQLHLLNKAVQRQNSVWHIFMTGIIYGVGLFFGSAIIATIIFGLFAPYLAEVEWIRAPFERGASVGHKVP